MKDETMVSIICNAYNHEKYIRDALDGFVMQKTDFPFEVLVHDDASTDRTADIIREYEKRYPNIIKPIYQTENQYSKGCGAVGKIQRARATGKYIALCEGDDYWTDPLKLQKQVDAMERHLEVDICAHASYGVNAAAKEIKTEFAPADKDSVLSAENVICGGGGYVATSSLLYRRQLDDNIPEFRKSMNIDYALQIHGSLRGGMLFLRDNMSCYRMRAVGSWSSRNYENIGLTINFLNRLCKMLNTLNDFTNKEYESIIKQIILGHEFKKHLLKENYSKIKKAPYNDIYKQLPIKEKIKISIKQYIPIVNTIYQNIKRGFKNAG